MHAALGETPDERAAGDREPAVASPRRRRPRTGCAGSTSARSSGRRAPSRRPRATRRSRAPRRPRARGSARCGRRGGRGRPPRLTCTTSSGCSRTARWNAATCSSDFRSAASGMSSTSTYTGHTCRPTPPALQLRQPVLAERVGLLRAVRELEQQVEMGVDDQGASRRARVASRSSVPSAATTARNTARASSTSTRPSRTSRATCSGSRSRGSPQPPPPGLCTITRSPASSGPKYVTRSVSRTSPSVPGPDDDQRAAGVAPAPTPLPSGSRVFSVTVCMRMPGSSSAVGAARAEAAAEAPRPRAVDAQRELLDAHGRVPGLEHLDGRVRHVAVREHHHRRPVTGGLAAVAAADGVDADERLAVARVEPEEEATRQLVAAGRAAIGDHRRQRAEDHLLHARCRVAVRVARRGPLGRHHQPGRQVEPDGEEVALVRAVERRQHRLHRDAHRGAGADRGEVDRAARGGARALEADAHLVAGDRHLHLDARLLVAHDAVVIHAHAGRVRAVGDLGDLAADGLVGAGDRRRHRLAHARHAELPAHRLDAPLADAAGGDHRVEVAAHDGRGAVRSGRSAPAGRRWARPRGSRRWCAKQMPSW